MSGMNYTESLNYSYRIMVESPMVSIRMKRYCAVGLRSQCLTFSEGNLSSSQEKMYIELCKIIVDMLADKTFSIYILSLMHTDR